MSGRVTPVFLAALFLLVAPQWCHAESKIRIAVLEFTEKNVGQWKGNVGKATEVWFVDELVNAEKFQVLERQQLVALLEEKGFQMSGDVDTRTAARAGRMAGVQVVVFGNVELAVKEQGGQNIGKIPAIGRFKGFDGFGATKKTLEGTLTGRAVNVETGEILFSKSQTVSESSVNVSVSESRSGTTWDETVVRKVFQPAVKTLVAEMVARMDTMKQILGVAAAGEGKIVQIKGDVLLVSLGALDEVQAGDRLSVVCAVVVKDPDTGAVLGRDEQNVGSLVVQKIAGEHLCRASAESGAGFAVGNIVKRR